MRGIVILPPYGVRTPNLVFDCYSPWGPEKKEFCLGGIGPYLGELWGFENCDFGVLWPILSRKPIVRFWPFFARRKNLQSSIDPENLIKIASSGFEKNALKFGKNAFST